MLFTRCPECDTTFRVTEDALKGANGQVRCGRCASVFNAYAELRQAPDDLVAGEPDAPAGAAATNAPGEDSLPNGDPGVAERTAAPAASVEAAPSLAAQPIASSPEDSAAAPEIAADDVASTQAPSDDDLQPQGCEPALSQSSQLGAALGADESVAGEPSGEPEPAESAPLALAESTVVSIDALEARARVSVGFGGARLSRSDEGIDALVAKVVAQVESGGAVEDSEAANRADELQAPEPEAITADQIDAVLGGTGGDDGAARAREPRWARAPGRRSSSGLWAASCAVCVLALALQTVNHYREQLVSRPTLGPWLQNAYAMLGIVVTPRWDVHQYSILDWVASAEPNGRGKGRLKITARIQNRAPRSQPYPSVQLLLKDRWEAAVATRVFSPNEYLATTATRGHALMAPGETLRAEIVVVDPGSDAYGFELDVCIEVEAHSLSCGSDKVFL
jgi:predicted Zn finger-like uncharacterized protein